MCQNTKFNLNISLRKTFEIVELSLSVNGPKPTLPLCALFFVIICLRRLYQCLLPSSIWPASFGLLSIDLLDFLYAKKNSILPKQIDLLEQPMQYFFKNDIVIITIGCF
jgi:hypothetical protein